MNKGLIELEALTNCLLCLTTITMLVFCIIYCRDNIYDIPLLLMGFMKHMKCGKPNSEILDSMMLWPPRTCTVLGLLPVFPHRHQDWAYIQNFRQAGWAEVVKINFGNKMHDNFPAWDCDNPLHVLFICLPTSATLCGSNTSSKSSQTL